MVVSENRVLSAARKCLEKNIPFALYMFPDEDNMHFCASSKTINVSIRDFFEKSVSGTFAIAPFIPSDTIEIITPDFEPDYVIALDEVLEINPGTELPVETTFEDYSLTGNEIIEQLNREGGKVVLSRVIVEKGIDPVSIAVDYFNALPSTFRSLFYTPERGIWLGATPELLASYSLENNSLTTMSLAGTRPLGISENWDSKNIQEHNFVTDFIKKVLSPNCENVKVSDLFSIKYGLVEHLCEIIQANGISDISEIISGLSPTPAVCGTPRNVALETINKYESHSRECYGGWLGVKCGIETKAFVNLRCAKIFCGEKNGEYIYNVYAGGGFTAKSIVKEEWEEAGQKASTLLKILKTSRIDG